jgi:hypothetical protein
MSQDSDPFDEDYVAEDEEVDPEDEGYTTGKAGTQQSIKS